MGMAWPDGLDLLPLVAEVVRDAGPLASEDVGLDGDIARPAVDGRSLTIGARCASDLVQYRCHGCHRVLFEAEALTGIVTIRCRKCGKVNQFP